MPNMTTPQEFSVELDGSPVVGRLHVPERIGGDRLLPAVLLCTAWPRFDPEVEDLYGSIIDALVNGGLSVAVLVEGSAGSRGSRLAVESIDDAAAILHGLATREELDLDRIGIVGHSLGAVVAACLARRSDRIARVCLVSPPTAESVAARGDGVNELTARLGRMDLPPGFFEGLDSLSPAEDLAAFDRPTLILHGAADRIVPPDESLVYRDAVRAAGHDLDYTLVARGDHFYTEPAARAACMEALTHFFAAPVRTRSS